MESQNTNIFSHLIKICIADIDECEEYGACPDNHMFCVNTPGTFQCACDKGYVMENGKCIKEAPGE